MLPVEEMIFTLSPSWFGGVTGDIGFAREEAFKQEAGGVGN